jgi:hypothetical protein
MNFEAGRRKPTGTKDPHSDVDLDVRLDVRVGSGFGPYFLDDSRVFDTGSPGLCITRSRASTNEA